jgi:hypothetical protein
MISIIARSDDSTAWLSALAQMISKKDDSDFFRDISAEHINDLKTRVHSFNVKIS